MTAHRHIDGVFVNQTGLLADLVDRAAGGATAKQHGGRAAQQLNAVIVEGVTVIKRRVAHAVYKNVACRRQGEATQTDVFFTTLSRQE